jgi:hypothetical protein
MFLFLVKFCILVTKKGGPHDGYKGLFLEEKRGTLWSHYENYFF